MHEIQRNREDRSELFYSFSKAAKFMRHITTFSISHCFDNFSPNCLSDSACMSWQPSFSYFLSSRKSIWSAVWIFILWLTRGIARPCSVIAVRSHTRPRWTRRWPENIRETKSLDSVFSSWRDYARGPALFVAPGNDRQGKYAGTRPPDCLRTCVRRWESGWSHDETKNCGEECWTLHVLRTLGTRVLNLPEVSAPHSFKFQVVSLELYKISLLISFQVFSAISIRWSVALILCALTSSVTHSTSAFISAAPSTKDTSAYRCVCVSVAEYALVLLVHLLFLNENWTGVTCIRNIVRNVCYNSVERECH